MNHGRARPLPSQATYLKLGNDPYRARREPRPPTGISPSHSKLPPSFFLELEYGTTYLCRVCWRKDDEIGVKFIEKPD